jgi:peptidoglycan/xylan/chitin deacetylase (PgdA/CDA1 family)
MIVRVPDLLRPLLGKLTWRKNPSSKVIYITFDDGPVPQVTPQVLDVLDEHGVKATFFCVGENVQKYPGIYADILRCGNKTGNHTFNHLKGTKSTARAYEENVRLAVEYIDSNLFRPPHGLITCRQSKAIREAGFEIIMWDVLTLDYDRNLSPPEIMQSIMRYSRNGSIIVFHDSIKAKNNVLSVLPMAIEFWKKEGYTLGIL